MPDALSALPPAVAALLARASVPPRLLREPAPGAAVLDLAVAAALRAPDHGGLRPARFVFISGAARAALGALMADSLARREPATPAERLDIERAKPLRAPMVVAAGAAIRPDHPKIPVWEQEASTAASIMNFLNAIDALGFGGVWLSSGALRDEMVKRALGFAATDRLLGWIYLGTPAPDRPVARAIETAGIARDWVPPAGP
ncbi:nitroreductase family protein [Roseomonas sp. HJA6]|uniref:Putative NAD(P)H nitroreductase n=1 Tax=Roseomonas alba TaxID=2846776 RepID=A0ABS7A786_9PROT|nr:nitroreductase family protein [Neoroseomonas alba]MBW6398163.1 nitroreductase family protein [Neoroseomonas alba]